MILTEWEYDVVELPVDTAARKQVLNARGADGWEAVGVLSQYEVVMKRPTAQFVDDPYVPRVQTMGAAT